jgi:DnaJ-class molecular chaperone
MGSDANRLNVDGHTFWRESTSGGEQVELTTQTGIELDEQGCRWIVSAPGAGTAEPVESGSREVMRYMRSVVKSMKRATHRAEVRPVPKPVSKRRRAAVGEYVPCPLCHGEAWHDCEVCAGSGAVTQRRADEWERDRAE